MQGCYIGFDTSNYTTSAAICTEDGRIIANCKRPLPVKEGERGLRQSEAVFAHVRNLPSLTEELGRVLAEEGLIPLAVGVSTRPRDAEGSYMPCFLAGRAAAGAFAAARDLPIYEFSHQNGHIMAALYSSGEAEWLTRAPFLAFHVSGGTTDVLYVRPDEKRFDIELIGTSLDLHAGQAVDRVGVALGLKFPCGKELEALAATCEENIPKPRICVKGLDCHLSGLENLALTLYQNTQNKALVAAYTLDFIGQTLIRLSAEVRARYPDIPMVYAGGVMSNRRIQTMLGKRFDNTYFSEPAFSADNAAGIALLCQRALHKIQ
jgi:N6-L-threonylcarbamoyladenine synthase